VAEAVVDILPALVKNKNLKLKTEDDAFREGMIGTGGWGLGTGENSIIPSPESPAPSPRPLVSGAITVSVTVRIFSLSAGYLRLWLSSSVFVYAWVSYLDPP